MPALAVTKMHGTLNDFIVLDRRRQPFVGDARAFAKRWCDRRAGIGGDGVLIIEESSQANVRLQIVNSDGSEAEMCGNGIRCVARFLHEKGENAELRIETPAGIIETQVVSTKPFLVRVNMGIPSFVARDLPFDDAVFVSMGNPHAVVFVASVADADLLALGKRQPEMNVHVVSVTDRSAIAVRHHERGAGMTQACGTGAVASAAAALRRGAVDSPVTVHVPGGELTVEWDGKGDAFLTGPAVREFDATIDS